MKKLKRKRALLAVELEVLDRKYNEERLQLERLSGTATELQFAQDELNIAVGVLTKLKSRVAAIRTESRQDGAVQLLVPATQPHQPIHPPPFKRTAVFSGVAFLSPLMLGFLLGFKQDTDAESSTLSGSAV